MCLKEDFIEQQQHSLVSQRRGRVVTDYKNRPKKLRSVLQIISNCQISTYKYGSDH